VVLNSNGNAKVDGIFCSDNGAKRVETTNPTSVFDLEEYTKEFSGESCEASKAMCDVFEELPRFIQWRIAGCDEDGRDQQAPCFEVAAAWKKGGNVTSTPPVSGLEAMAADKAKATKKSKKKEEPEEDFIDDDIPF
jgi:hypothetical protein